MRGGLRVGVIEKRRFGGLLMNARRVENYPGFPGGISGKELADLFTGQLLTSGVTCIEDEILEIRPGKRHLLVGRSDIYQARYVVIATGTRPKSLDINVDIDVFYEIIDLPDHSKRVAIIGGGDIAFDYALSCDDAGIEVTLLLRSPPKAHPMLIKEVQERKRIGIINGISCIFTRNGKLVAPTDCKEHTLHVDALVVAIGREPEDGLLSMVHHQENIFSAGSMKFPSRLRHVGIAIGDGIRTACIILSKKEVDHGDYKTMGR
jgi:thioredoxin reductase